MNVGVQSMGCVTVLDLVQLLVVVGLVARVVDVVDVRLLRTAHQFRTTTSVSTVSSQMRSCASPSDHVGFPPSDPEG